jgi:hypothetical protein
VKPYRFLTPARTELFEIADYYEAQAGGLGAEFLDESANHDRLATTAPFRPRQRLTRGDSAINEATYP